MKQFLYISTLFITLLSCSVPPTLEGVWVSAYEQTPRQPDRQLVTKVITIDKDSILVHSFYAGYENGEDTNKIPYQLLKDSIRTIVEEDEEIMAYSFKKDSLVLTSRDSTRTVYFRYPPRKLKLNRLSDAYRWSCDTGDGTIEFMSDSTLLYNNPIGESHKRWAFYKQTDDYLLFYMDGPYPLMVFPLSGNADNFTARTNFDGKMRYQFVKQADNPVVPDIVGKWKLQQMALTQSDFPGGDTLIHYKNNPIVEITSDSIFWGQIHYGYQWDHTKQYLLCYFIGIDSNDEGGGQDFTTFKLITSSGTDLNLERQRSYGVFTYTFSK
ncbi:MAG: hypothetical protein LBN06_06530 [Prevotellaceae bacterium]|jgi:hypothetical protein|nr:hypothetical protein [Prevotellaceae bacterium]